MLICSMTVSVDGFVSDRDGSLAWTAPPDDELFGFHLEGVRALGGYVLGRRLYEAMLPWETDPSMRSTELQIEFADVWCALPKIVFSRTLDHVEGNARLARKSLADEVATAVAGTTRDLQVGGAQMVGQAIEQDLLDELRLFRAPMILGGGTPLLPPVPGWMTLDRVETRTFSGGVVLERYRRNRTPDA